MSKGFYLVYDIGNTNIIYGRMWYGLPHAIYTDKQVKDAPNLLTEWPEDHVVVHFHNDGAGTITQQTVEHYRWLAENKETKS